MRSLNLDASTSQDVYLKGDTLHITVQVTDENGVAVEGATITASIDFTRIRVNLSGTSDANGEAVLSYKINTRKTGIGHANIILSAEKEGYDLAEITLSIETQ